MWTRLACVLLLAAAARAESLEQATRDYLLAAADAPPPEKKRWQVKGGLGFALTNNGDSTTLNFNVEATREFGKWKVKLTERSTFEKTDGDTTESEHIFTERLERLLNEKSSLFQELWLETDEAEDLNVRFILTFGYRRKLVEKEKFKLSGDAGLGWQYEDFDANSNSDFIAQFGIDWEWQITKFLTYTQVFVYYPKLTDTPEFRFVSESVFTTPLGESFDLRFAIIDQYNSDPEAGAEHNDLKITLNIVFRFPKK